MGWLFALSGAAAGAAQAGLLGRAAGASPSPLGVLLRLFIVAAVLVVAARGGYIAAGTAGWATGFLLGAVLVHRRLG
jgi:hypothetical protein